LLGLLRVLLLLLLVLRRRRRQRSNGLARVAQGVAKGPKVAEARRLALLQT
jgi:hypothetical protein